MAETSKEDTIRYIRGYDILCSDSECARTYYHYVCDEGGSTSHILDETGKVLNQYEYDAFGNLIKAQKEVPVVARFTQEDTYRGDGLNLYAYCRNNPVGYYDPSGYSTDGCGIGKNGNSKSDSRRTLYHYTNEKGMEGIVNSQKLNPSLKANNPKDARYGNGQYLSDIKPNTQTPAGLAKKFINVPNKYKYTRYVEVDVTDLEVMQGRDGVFVIPNELPLDLTGRIVSTGKVGKN